MVKKRRIYRIFSLIRHDRLSVFFMVLADVAFITSILLLGIFLSNIIPKDPGFYTPGLTTALLGILFILFYVGVCIIIYCSTKFLILKKFAVVSHLRLRGFWRFFLLNVMLFAVIAIVFFGLGLMTRFFALSKFLAVVGVVIFALLGIIAYYYLNLLHSFFAVGNSRPLSHVFFAALKKMADLKRLYLPLVIFLVVFLFQALVFGIVGFFIRDLLFATFENYTNYYPVYRSIFTAVFYVLFYLAVFFNRFVFMDIVKHKN